MITNQLSNKDYGSTRETIKYPSAGRSHIQERKPKARLAPMYRTYPIMLIFDDGEAIDAEVTMPNKPYWGGALEKEIRDMWNGDGVLEHKVVRVKVFRNTREGGKMIHDRRVIDVW